MPVSLSLAINTDYSTSCDVTLWLKAQRLGFALKKPNNKHFHPWKRLSAYTENSAVTNSFLSCSLFSFINLKEPCNCIPLKRLGAMGTVMAQSGLGWKKKTEKKYISKKKKSHHKTLSNYYCNTSGTVIRDGWLMFPFSFGDIRKLYKSSRLCLQDLQHLMSASRWALR